MKYLIIIGNPVQGFDIFGPFDDVDQAITWGEDLVQGDWWLTELVSPADYRFD